MHKFSATFESRHLPCCRNLVGLDSFEIFGASCAKVSYADFSDLCQFLM